MARQRCRAAKYRGLLLYLQGAACAFAKVFKAGEAQTPVVAPRRCPSPPPHRHVRPQRHRTVFLVAHSFGTCLAVRLAAALGSALAGLVLIGAFHPGLGGGAMRSLFLLPETVRSMPASFYEPVTLRLETRLP